MLENRRKNAGQIVKVQIGNLKPELPLCVRVAGAHCAPLCTVYAPNVNKINYTDYAHFVIFHYVRAYILKIKHYIIKCQNIRRLGALTECFKLIK